MSLCISESKRIRSIATPTQRVPDSAGYEYLQPLDMLRYCGVFCPVLPEKSSQNSDENAHWLCPWLASYHLFPTHAPCRPPPSTIATIATMLRTCNLYDKMYTVLIHALIISLIHYSFTTVSDLYSAAANFACLVDMLLSILWEVMPAYVTGKCWVSQYCTIISTCTYTHMQFSHYDIAQYIVYCYNPQ
jgi:hypothetical protein